MVEPGDFAHGGQAGTRAAGLKLFLHLLPLADVEDGGNEDRRFDPDNCSIASIG